MMWVLLLAIAVAVFAGLVFVLIFGQQAALGGWLQAHGYQVIFAPPALVL